MSNRKSVISVLALIFAIFMVNGCLLSQVQTSFHIKNGVQFNKANCRDLTRLIALLPLAQTNQYQTVSNVQYHNGVVSGIPESDEKYIVFTLLQNDLQKQENVFNIFYEFDITLHPVYFDFSRITQIYPYNTASENYLWYTGASGIFVDPANPKIQAVGSALWEESVDIVDYARRCYEYVARNYRYLNPNTGIHPLATILAAGGGDCGNLSSIFVSLLRFKNIPARHIITFRPNGSYHVWADFYLENYGWIPVDVTYKQANPGGDYFGKYNGDGIVVSKDLWLYVQADNAIAFHAALLQNFFWWYWHGPGGCLSVSASHYIIPDKPTSVREVDTTSLILYPNPARDHIGFWGASLPDRFEVEIYSLSGVLVCKRTIAAQSTLDVSSLESGCYVVKVSADSIQIVKKMVKM